MQVELIIISKLRLSVTRHGIPSVKPDPKKPKTFSCIMAELCQKTRTGLFYMFFHKFKIGINDPVRVFERRVMTYR